RVPRRFFLCARRNKGWATAICLTFLAFWALAVAGMLVNAAVAIAHEREQFLGCEALLNRSQRIRLHRHVSGWSEEAWQLVRQAAKIRRDPVVRSQAAATLIGLDAQIIKEFSGEGASSVAFDKTGKRLLLGGTMTQKTGVGQNEREAKPARLCNEVNGEVLSSKLFGMGPVTFDKNDTPL